MAVNEPMCLRPGTVVDVWVQTGAHVLMDMFTIECPLNSVHTPPVPPPRLTLHAARALTINERRQLRRLLGNLGEPRGVELPPPPIPRTRPTPTQAGTWVKTGTVAAWYHGNKKRMGKAPAARTHSEGKRATTTKKESDKHNGNP